MIAVMTPMANPTVEQELRRLLPPDLPWVTGRLVAKLGDAMARLRVYGETLAASFDQFGGMKLSSVAFACTGSSYLLGPEREDEIARETGLPVLWATGSILAELRACGARRIALVSPYPQDLHEAGLAYWSEQGLDVIHAMRIEIGTRDTRAIYGLTETVARPAVADALMRKPDAVLISGTGMPTLGLIQPDAPIPVLSSNQCLAAAIRRAAALGHSVVTKLCTSYIAGWAAGAGAERLPIVSPVTEEVIAELAEADADEVNRAVETARAAFAKGDWRRSSVAQRQRVLRRIAALIRERAESIADAECANTGIPLKQVRERHVPRAAANFDFFADYIGQCANESYEQEAPFLTVVRREPVGVAALIAPWNAPIALATMEMAGALAFGNCFVLKPSEMTPLEFGPLFDILAEAGLPPGVAGMVNGRGAVTGKALVEHPGVDVLAFIGGTETGRSIARAAGDNLKKYVAELGGKSANIVTAACDLDRALDASLVSIFSNNGQQCLAGSRILVEESIADRFIERFVARTRRLRVGDPRDPGTEISPVISRGQYERVLGFARDAQVLVGGVRAEGFERGFYVAPTAVMASDNRAPLCQEEIFGPFATFLTYRDIDHAIEIANDSQFGLVAYLWSDDLPTIMRVTSSLDAGTIWVNTPVARDLRAPFGGFKNSGVGRTGGHSSRALFTEEKVVTIPLNDFPIARLGAE